MAAKFPVSVIIAAIDKATGPIRSIGRAMNRGLAGGLRGVAAAGGKATAVLTGMAAKLGIIAGGAGLIGVLKLAEGHANAADEIGKFARQVGVGVEALQEYEFAADRQGVPQEVFRKSLEQLSKRMGDLRRGTGSLKTLLDSTPESFQRAVAATTSNEEALELFLGALNKIPDADRRASFAQEVFGKSGARMTRLAEAGAEGIEVLRAEVRALGGVISEDGTRAAESYVDSLANWDRAMGGLKATIGGALLPLFQPLIDRGTKWVAANREFIATKVHEAFQMVVDAVKSIDFDAIRSGLARFRDIATEAWDKLGGLSGALKAFGVLVGVSLAGKIASGILALGQLASAFIVPLLASIKTVYAFLAANPIYLAVAAIGAAVYLIVSNWQPISEWFGRLWSGIKAIFTTFVDWVSALWKDPVGTLKLTWDAVTGFFSDLWAGVTAAFRAGWEYIEGIIDKVRGAADFLGGITGAAGSAVASQLDTAAAGRVADLVFNRPAPSPLAAVSGAGVGAQVGGRIEVDFRNVPQGVNVSSPTATNPRVPLQANVGRRTAALPGGR